VPSRLARYEPWLLHSHRMMNSPMAMVVCLAVCSRAQSPWRFWSHPVVSLSLRYTNTAVRWDNLDVLSPRGARLALSALPSTTLQFATSDDVPEVLERAMLRLPAIKQPAYRCSAPKDRPDKRSKIGKSEGRHGTATKDLPKQTASPKTTPRLQASSPTPTTASPGSTIATIR
jgi:hypothetical protein